MHRGVGDAGLAPDQIKSSDALTALKPLLESIGILKIGFNIKFNAVIFAQHGVTLRNHDDAQLMSYALDAGRTAHGLDGLAERGLGVRGLIASPITGADGNVEFLAFARRAASPLGAGEIASVVRGAAWRFDRG